ncbi:hypothetical protein OFN28_24880, partial [Escherichia coli]|nr:hypothetical protein [Escherichia coli]
VSSSPASGIELEKGVHSHQQDTVTASTADLLLENHGDHAPPACATRLTPRLQLQPLSHLSD